MTTDLTNTHDGTLLSVEGDTLTSKCTDGQTHHHTVARGATVTRDGKSCDLADLKAGTPIRVTSQKDAPMIVTAVESGRVVKAPPIADKA
jgi:hypothetical protein